MIILVSSVGSTRNFHFHPFLCYHPDMAQAQSEVLEIFLTSGGKAGRVSCPHSMRPAAGQYMLASCLRNVGTAVNSTASLEPLPVPLFPSLPACLEQQQAELTVAPPLPDNWSVGTSLLLRGPLGRGFHLPSTAQRVALVAWGTCHSRLLPLAYKALACGASVSLCLSNSQGDLPVSPLPVEVEILPLAGLPDLLSWAEYMAVDLPREAIAALRRSLRLESGQHPGFLLEVLVETPMPCGGTAECGVCAVKTQRGWKLACKDGPVFDLMQLEEF